jgi:hypothetical protein
MMGKRGTLTIAFATVALLVVLGGWACFNGASLGQSRTREHTLETIPFNGTRAYQHLRDLCSLGPRISGSPGMEQQRLLLTEHFKKLGAAVTEQAWEVRHPETGEPTRLVNLIVSWQPEQRERLLLCTHFDTRPYPDEDPIPARRRGPFLGANDGTSGVAVLMELGQHMQELGGTFGVDFVFFDAEEFIFVKGRDPFFLGSERFARQYVAQPPPFRYRAGVLLDMVGDRDLQIFYEKNSMYDRATRNVCTTVWSTAQKLRVKEFISRTKHEVNDDHIALIKAGIPTCDVIDFDYRDAAGNSLWHTTADVPENCSALSLAKVGWVMLEWLRTYR